MSLRGTGLIATMATRLPRAAAANLWLLGRKWLRPPSSHWG